MRKIIRSILLLSALLAINCACVLPSNNIRMLPDDIDPESLSRLPMIHKHDLDADGQRIFEFIMGTETATPNLGPAAVSLYNPKVAEAMQMLNQEVRYRSVIGRRYTEVAILVASREFDQQYEWSMHEDAARTEGVPGVVIDTIKYNRDVAEMSKEESLIIRFGRQILREHRLDAEVFAEAEALFGRRGTFELAAIMGDYVMAAIMLHAVDQHLAADRPALLPIKER